MKKFDRYVLYEVLSIIITCAIFIAITKSCDISPNTNRNRDKIIETDTIIK